MDGGSKRLELQPEQGIGRRRQRRHNLLPLEFGCQIMVEYVVWIVKQMLPNEGDEGGFDAGLLELGSQLSGIECRPKHRHRSAAL